MLYSLLCEDRPNQQALRAATRSAHLAYLARFQDQIKFAGPLLSEDQSAPLGSLLIVEFASREAVSAFAEEDPYHKAGLFAQVRIWPLRQVIPQ